jgi:chromosome partitioning protein
MTKIIGIAQLKGGTGRSTIATNLAGLLARKGTTALIDCDMPQGTAASWYTLRADQNKLGNLTLATVNDHKQLAHEIEVLSENHDYIVLDAPPRIAEITRIMLMVSDLVLIPLSPSAPEIWATSDLLDTVKEAGKVRSNIVTRIAWNKYRGHTRSAQELSEAVKAEIKVSALKTRLGLRVGYSEALGTGLVADELPDQKIKAELSDFGDEVLKLLKRK